MVLDLLLYPYLVVEGVLLAPRGDPVYSVFSQYVFCIWVVKSGKVLLRRPKRSCWRFLRDIVSYLSCTSTSNWRSFVELTTTFIYMLVRCN